jgi:hypothetical protein
MSLAAEHPRPVGAPARPRRRSTSPASGTGCPFKGIPFTFNAHDLRQDW